MKLLAPNGNPSNLTPEQYKLVRTPEFKAWFGDWENSPETASKVVDENGEPLVVWHGTKKGSQLYVFLEKQDSGSHFGTKKSAIDRRQDTGDFDYELIPCFLKINKPLFVDEDMNWESEMYSDMDYGEPIYRSFTDWAEKKGLDIYYRGDGIVVNEDMLPKGFYVKFNDKYKRYIVYDELGVVAGGDTKTQSIEHALSMLGKKITKPNGIKTLKELINDNGYDGIFYVNEIEDKGNLSYLVIEPNKIKLADGTNTTFDFNNPDIRFDDGGITITDEFSTQSYDFGNVGYSIKKNNLEVGQIQYNINKEKGIVSIYLLEVLEKGIGAKVINYFFNNGINIIYGDAVDSIKFWEKMGAKFDEFNEDINGYPFTISKEDFVQTKYYENTNPDVRFENGGELNLTSEQVEQKLGRKLHWWNDDVVTIQGSQYKKVFLKSEYRKI